MQLNRCRLHHKSFTWEDKATGDVWKLRPYSLKLPAMKKEENMCGQKRRPVKPRINLWTVVTQEGYSLSGNISIMLGTGNTQGRYQKMWQFDPSLESLFAFQKSNMWIRYKKTLRFLVSAGSIFVSDSGIPPIPSSYYNGIIITP